MNTGSFSISRAHGATPPNCYNFRLKKESGFIGSAAHAALADLFRRNDALLRDDLDRLMELFRSDDADFYNAYWAARSIKNFGHRYRQTEEKPAEPEEPIV